MIENYNLGKRLGEYSLNNVSYSYKIQSSRAYNSNIKSEDSQVIKLGNIN